MTFARIPPALDRMRHTISAFGVAAAVLWALLTPVARADAAPWPQFRGGPANNGIAKGPLPEKLTRLWVYETEGAVRSSAVLGHGRAYIGSDDGSVHAIELATGKRAWAFETGVAVEAPPLLHHETLFVGSTDGVLHALDLEGKLLWKGETGGKITGSAAIVKDEAADRTLVLVGSHAGTLHAFDIAEARGKPVWTYQIAEPINGGISIADGKAVFGACDDRVHIVSASSGKGLRTLDIGAIIAGTAALDKGDAYVGTLGGDLIRADMLTGKVTWRFRDKDFELHSSPAVTDSSVIIGGRDKAVHAVDRQSGERLWKFTTKGRVDSSPVVSGERVVVGSDDGRLYLLALRTGALVDAYEVGGGISGSPAVGTGLVVVGTESGEVFAFGEAR